MQRCRNLTFAKNHFTRNGRLSRYLRVNCNSQQEASSWRLVFTQTRSIPLIGPLISAWLGLNKTGFRHRQNPRSTANTIPWRSSLIMGRDAHFIVH